MANSSKSGFSLIELSIVIIILALLAVGITSGQSLIQSAELRSITSDVHKLSTSIYSFKTKYMAFPGDFSQGGLYPNTFTGFSAGDGDGQIRVLSRGTTSAEANQAWFHLSQAGMLDSNIEPVAANATPSAVGTATTSPSIPPSKMSGAGYQVQHGSVLTNAPFSGDFRSYHVILFGIPAAPTAGTNTGVQQVIATLTPEQAQTLDRKSDDGQPNSGSIRGVNSTDVLGGNSCVSGSDYRTDYAGTACGLGFQI